MYFHRLHFQSRRGAAFTLPLLMNPVLIGDYDLETRFAELAGTDFSYREILEREQWLSNVYAHALKDGCAALRMVTGGCSPGRLEKENLRDRIEPAINVCVSSAKTALKLSGADALLCGTLRGVLDSAAKDDNDVIKEISEQIVYIADFGVDSMVIEEIEDYGLFEMTVGMTRKLSGVPLAPFFRTKTLNKALLGDYEKFCSELELELMGFQIEIDDIGCLEHYEHRSGSPLGLMFCADRPLNADDAAAILSVIRKNSPTVIFAGKGIPRNIWLEIAAKVRADGER